MIKLIQFLNRISPYVVLCGSYAKGQETEASDLDFYVRQKPQNPEEESPIDTSYLPDIIQIAEEFGYEIDSCVLGSITLSAETTGIIQLEFSYLYRLPKGNPIRIRNVLGVDFLTCEDDKNVPFEDCFESLDEQGEVINFLPSYEEKIDKFRRQRAI